MTLDEFFRDNPKAALAFSGGADSTYLLWAAVRAGARMRAYYVRSAFQPRFEYEDAERAAREIGADMRVLTLDVLSAPHVRENPADRCYYCKQAIFSAILAVAGEDGYPLVLDGTNGGPARDAGAARAFGAFAAAGMRDNEGGGTEALTGGGTVYLG